MPLVVAAQPAEQGGDVRVVERAAGRLGRRLQVGQRALQRPEPPRRARAVPQQRRGRRRRRREGTPQRAAEVDGLAERAGPGR